MQSLGRYMQRKEWSLPQTRPCDPASHSALWYTGHTKQCVSARISRLLMLGVAKDNSPLEMTSICLRPQQRQEISERDFLPSTNQGSEINVVILSFRSE